MGARSTLLRQRNPSDRETRAITALTEPVIADHTLYEYNIKNSTVHDNATDYTEYGFTAAGKSFDIEAERTQTKHLDDHAKDGTAPPCDEILEGHVMSRSVRTFHCKNAASFSKWEVELEGERVAVQVSHVNGSLTLPSKANMSLVVLFLQQTNIKDFTNHTQNLSTLEELNLSDNPDFDAASLLQLGKLPSLVKLQLAGTALATLNWRLEQVLKDMPALQYLDISSSNLHHLPLNTFKENTKLQRLYINGNAFINLKLDQGLLQQLTHLNISGCSITKLEVENRSIEAVETHLQSVDLSHNQLSSLPASFINIISENLAHLNVADNLWKKSCKLCSLYHLWNYKNKHPDLVHESHDLNCFNQKEALKACGWEECPVTCTCDSQSKTVDCSGTDLKSIPLLGPSDAESLILENNNLLNMSGIESPVWCKLKTVNANYNRIASIIPADTVGHCTCFDYDDFYEEDENCLPQSLQNLSLSHNRIKKLSQSDCQLLYSLRELHLSGNKVEHLGSDVCSSIELLEVLSLNNNSCSDLEEQDVAPYPNLRELNLSFNKLATLPYRIIELMPKLTVLDVSHNRLREFSGETSTPDTPFTPMVPIPLKELDLSYNNLELIKPVLNLKHIPTLKKLSINNNPWECSCESIIDLVDRVFKDIKQTAMVNAVRTLRCQKPLSLKGVLINFKALQNCQEPEHQKGFFTIMVGILIIICLGVLVFYITCKKISPSINDVLGLSFSENDVTFRRRYSVWIVHSWDDDEMVKADLVDHLKGHNYSVAWNENALELGRDWDASIEKIVGNSRRMLVVASKNFINFPRGKQMIQRGLKEERNTPGFKVVALEMNDLPKQQLYSELHKIVIQRTPVRRQDRKYIEKICDFIPSPGPSQRTMTFTETDLYYILLQHYEKMKKRENQRQNQRAHIQEVFRSQNLNSHGSYVGGSSLYLHGSYVVDSGLNPHGSYVGALNLNPHGRYVGASNEPQSVTGATGIMTSMADDIWETVHSCYRSHGNSVPVPDSEQPHTFSFHHILKENNGGEEEVAQIEGFSRKIDERHSTKF